VNGLLKMRDLAERSGVSAGTIKHYLREGLPRLRRRPSWPSRNMATTRPTTVERSA
jgi:predicted site-specific integrase-resolvase